MKIIVIKFKHGSRGYSKGYSYLLDPKSKTAKIGWTLHTVLGITKYRAYSKDVLVYNIYETDELPCQVTTMLTVESGYSYKTSVIPETMKVKKQRNLLDLIEETKVNIEPKEVVIARAKTKGRKFLSEAEEDLYYNIYCYIKI